LTDVEVACDCNSEGDGIRQSQRIQCEIVTHDEWSDVKNSSLSETLKILRRNCEMIAGHLFVAADVAGGQDRAMNHTVFIVVSQLIHSENQHFKVFQSHSSLP
jgi:hypothetical protein